MPQFYVLGGTGNHDLDQGILNVLNVLRLGRRPLHFDHLLMDEFADGEPDFRIKTPDRIKGRHVLLFQSIHTGDLAEQFLTLVWACKYQYDAASITAVVPFFRFRRQDHREKDHEIDRNAMMAHMMRAAGVDHIVICDAHSQKTLDNLTASGIDAHNADPTSAFAAELHPVVEKTQREGREFFVYAPDAGSIMRAIRLADLLGVRVAASIKKRAHSGTIELVHDDDVWAKLQERYGGRLIRTEDLPTGSVVCVREDEVASGSTARKSGWKLRNEHGAHAVHFCATHPVLTRGWRRTFIDDSPYGIMLLGNTIHRSYEKRTGGLVTEIDMSAVIAHTLLPIVQGIK